MDLRDTMDDIIHSVVSGHLAELVHGDDPVPITVKQFEGLLEAVDVLARQLPVRAEPLRVLRHAVLQRSSLTGSPSAAAVAVAVAVATSLLHSRGQLTTTLGLLLAVALSWPAQRRPG